MRLKFRRFHASEFRRFHAGRKRNQIRSRVRSGISAASPSEAHPPRELVEGLEGRVVWRGVSVAQRRGRRGRQQFGGREKNKRLLSPHFFYWTPEYRRSPECLIYTSIFAEYPLNLVDTFRFDFACRETVPCPPEIGRESHI